MKGTKRIVGAIAAIALTVGLWGCGQSANTSVETKTNEATTTVEATEGVVQPAIAVEEGVRPRTIVTTDLAAATC